MTTNCPKRSSVLGDRHFVIARNEAISEFHSRTTISIRLHNTRKNALLRLLLPFGDRNDNLNTKWARTAQCSNHHPTPLKLRGLSPSRSTPGAQRRWAGCEHFFKRRFLKRKWARMYSNHRPSRSTPEFTEGAVCEPFFLLI